MGEEEKQQAFNPFLPGNTRSQTEFDNSFSYKEHLERLCQRMVECGWYCRSGRYDVLDWYIASVNLVLQWLKPLMGSDTREEFNKQKIEVYAFKSRYSVSKSREDYSILLDHVELLQENLLDYKQRIGLGIKMLRKETARFRMRKAIVG